MPGPKFVLWSAVIALGTLLAVERYRQKMGH